MLTVDSQVHVYERDHPGRPWADVLHGPPEMTGPQMIAAMDAAGVDGAVLVSPWSNYRFDTSYAVEVHAAHPGRFALVAPVDTSDPAVEDRVAEWAAGEDRVAVRLMPVLTDASHPGVRQVVKAARRHGMAVNVFCREHLPEVGRLAAEHPDVQLVIDHLGLRNTLSPPPPPNPFQDLPNLLKLAAYPNVAIKISAACVLSHEPYPYKDLWEPVGRIFEAFGMDRCMWGTDWTRALEFLTYQQGVDAFREAFPLSDSDRAALMGETLCRLYGWRPSRADSKAAAPA